MTPGSNHRETYHDREKTLTNYPVGSLSGPDTERGRINLQQSPATNVPPLAPRQAP